jgi:ABC-type antimicrobial peptide transport system permease subunit
MRAIDVLSMCLRNLWKRKLRTFLTLLGVMIGTGSIVLMISLGAATNAQFEQMIEDMNLNMTEIQVFPMWDGGMWTADGGYVETTAKDLTDESVERFRRLPGVRTATPVMSMELIFRSGPYVMPASVTGIRPEALADMYTLEAGRFILPNEEFAVVFSGLSERGFFDASDRRMTWSERQWNFSPDVPTLVDVINDPIRIEYDTNAFWNTRTWGWGNDDDFGMDIEEDFNPVRSFDINVVGLIETPSVEAMMWGRGGHTIYMDIETLQALHQIQNEHARREAEECEWNPRFSAVRDGPRQTYNDVRVRAMSMEETSDVAEAIRDLGYNVWFPGDWIEQQRGMQRGIQTLLAAIAAVSLFVAAINIANTMITSVTERTREIGVMKVIGASISDVLKLFLLEATTIGLLGGMLGVCLALGCSYFMNNFDIEFIRNLNMGAPTFGERAEDVIVSLITPQLCGLALIIASGVGVISGFYPAWRATRLSALAAIRGD